jgi:polyphosphate kinase
VELCKLQEWVKVQGLADHGCIRRARCRRQGGTIKAITERVSPRVFRVVALPALSDREKSQMYIQRYMQHFPAAGEVVIFDRSWYNRAGVEYVMDFCTEAENQRFLELCPQVEKVIAENGIHLVKYWLEVRTRNKSGVLKRELTIRCGSGS